MYFLKVGSVKRKLFQNLKVLDTNLSQQEIKLLKTYIDQNIIKQTSAGWELNSLYKVGQIVLKKYRATLLCTHEIENVDLEFSDLNGAKDGDFVLVKRIINPKSHSKARVIEIIEHSSKPTLVYYFDTNFFLVSHFDVRVDFGCKDKLSDYDILEVDLSSGQIIKKLGNINDAKIDEEISTLLYGEEYRFDGFSEIKIDDLEDTRVDLTHLSFCTIDPPTAKDHDDAIYFNDETRTLYVAIADVSHFVKSGTILDEEAAKRATSIYLPHKVLPMLPPILSENICSLRPNEEKFAFVFEITIAENMLDIEYSKLYTAKIKSQAKYSYDEIDKLICGEISEGDNEIYISLIKFYRLSARIRKNRLKNGFDFDSEELRLVLDENFELVNVNIETSSPSHSLIEEAMLLANTEAAKLLKSRGIFRNHAEPSQKSIDKLLNELSLLGIKAKHTGEIHKLIQGIQQSIKDLPYKKEINELLIKSQQLAVYSSVNIGHFGLGFKAYSHFTSPIRRYADLVLHRILKSKKIPTNIDAICEHINIVERKVNELVWDFEDRKFARWAKKNQNQKIEVMITDTGHGIAKSISPIAGMKVYLDDYEGEKLFEKLVVTIKGANLISKQITVSRTK